MSQKFRLFAAYVHSIALFCRKRRGLMQPGDHSISVSSGWFSPHYCYDTSDCRLQTTN